MKWLVLLISFLYMIALLNVRHLSIENAQLKNILNIYNIGIPYELNK